VNRTVQVIEVGPRDGLQNEKQPLTTDFKLGLIKRLEECGFPEVEVTSMVHPKWVPQLADAADLLERLKDLPTDHARTVLVPNLKGLQRAIEARVQRVAVFIAASETFSKKNTNRSIDTSLEQTLDVVHTALEQGLTVRGYISTVFVCPFEGRISPTVSAGLTRKLLEFGCDQISLGDTVGAAVPEDIDAVLSALEGVNPDSLALHLHDTYGTALANVTRGLDRGIRAFDSSVGGAGGCPYAPGATGNLATEDLLYLLDRGGWEHGIDRDKVLGAARYLEAGLGRLSQSHLMAVSRAT
jgi:hydroxymethylglutaryl-CoA lyase